MTTADASSMSRAANEARSKDERARGRSAQVVIMKTSTTTCQDVGRGTENVRKSSDAAARAIPRTASKLPEARIATPRSALGHGDRTR